MRIKTFLAFISEAYYNHNRAFGDRPEWSESGNTDYPSSPDYNYRTEDPLTMDMDDMIGDIYQYTLDKKEFAENYKQWVEEEAPKRRVINNRGEEDNPGKWVIPDQITIEELKANFERFKKFWNLNIEFPVDIKEFYENIQHLVKRYEKEEYPSWEDNDPDLTKTEVEKYWKRASSKYTKQSRKFDI